MSQSFAKESLDHSSITQEIYTSMRRYNVYVPNLVVALSLYDVWEHI